MCDSTSEIIRRTVEYMANFLEQPHPVFGGLPVCPFTRQARLNDQILYKVDSFDFNLSLNYNSPLLESIEEFNAGESYEVLLVLHPDPRAMTPEETREFVRRLNSMIFSRGLIAFGGHPDDSFNIRGVYTRRLPYITLTVQAEHLLAQASDRLLPQYYQNWTPENLKDVGFPRSHSPGSNRSNPC